MAAGPVNRIPPDVRLAAARARAYDVVRRILHRLGLVRRRWVSDTGFANVPLDADVLVHFGDDPSRLYQLEQWLPVLERLHEEHPVAVLTRDPATLVEVSRATRLPVLFVKHLDGINRLLERNDVHLMLYVNHSNLNFQTLMFGEVLHVHLNHGESDKRSMASHQSKAYDRVFVAGPAAVDRYRNNVFEFDEGKVVVVGRPQLDVSYPQVLQPSDRPTVLYAPTWAGDRAAMNYSSVDVYGLAMVEQILAAGQYRLVYKPHPRVPEEHKATAPAHRAIVAAIERAAGADPAAGHRVELSASVLSLIPDADAMITDVSSVGLDFLYLATDRPLLLTDRHNDSSALTAAAPLAAGADIINAETVGATAQILAAALQTDPRKADRARVNEHYFGGLARGESTTRFLTAVDEAITAQQTWSKQRGAVARPPTLRHE
ncbi:MAG TPA: CDP-glycerol glycerophosphotransferase family protein [Egibacteraceae bacterium]|nr:CDP-glycerol glycerophosphotransferase family protein [Egibacteraceae bacterium]